MKRVRLSLFVAALSLTGSFFAPPLTAQQEQISQELRELYEADQADRQFDTPPTQEQWVEISARDHERQHRVKELLAVGALETGDDYYHAAMVLQHGDGSDDILTAHILASVAGFKGHEGGPWLSAATLDRYLHRTDKPQRLGTQYVKTNPDEPWSQGLYDNWLHDRIRAAFRVPTLEEQVARVREMNGGN